MAPFISSRPETSPVALDDSAFRLSAQRETHQRFDENTLSDLPPRKTPINPAGVGDVLEARGLRARWNAYRDEPELTLGYGNEITP